MLPTNLNDLTPEHIQGLIDSEVAESLTLEYKQKLPSKQSEEKREFLYDVASMANAAGGDIVFGIAERPGENNAKTGIAEKLLGERWSNIQAEVIRLSSYVKDGIAPRLGGVELKPISCRDGDALVVRIPSSWNKPHLVTIGGVDRFYKRTGTTNNPMNVEEIRRAFLEQGELRETIARWRQHRVELIDLGPAPVVLASGVITLFHVIPSDAFTPGAFTQSWRIPPNEKNSVYVPDGNLDQRYNADGFLCHGSRKNDGPVNGYTQLFRSGIVEYGFSHHYQPIASENAMILGRVLEREMVYCYQDANGRLRREGRTGAVYIGFSLMRIFGKSFYNSPIAAAWQDRKYEIRQSAFSSPEVYVDLSEPAENAPFAKTLRPLVDTLWQVGGREQTPCIVNGVWDPFAR